MNRYRRRVSGALYDRIDLVIEVPAVASFDMASPADVASIVNTEAIRRRVARAYERQIGRQGKPNARLMPAEVDAHCRRSHESEGLLARAMSRFSISARGYHRVLKVARTIADLGGSAILETADVAEAIGYRREWGLPS